MRGFVIHLSLLLAACTSDPTEGGAGEGSGGNTPDTGSNTSGATSGTLMGSDTTNPTTTGSGGGGTGAVAFVASESVARRLSRAELDNTLSTLLLDDASRA
ncbi:MAG TPA: hypothetical protein VFU02_19455, partial [Polyangiaceae bacterium]|nr:hypothetical protein [Polyangiaceae bacterium]